MFKFIKLQKSKWKMFDNNKHCNSCCICCVCKLLRELGWIVPDCTKLSPHTLTALMHFEAASNNRLLSSFQNICFVCAFNVYFLYRKNCIYIVLQTLECSKVMWVQLKSVNTGISYFPINIEWENNPFLR